MKIKVAVLLCASLIVNSAMGQTDQWPPSQVTIMVPFAAGATPDIVARILADKFHERTGKTFIVENRPGAGGNLAISSVARGPSNGSVIGIGLLGALGLNKQLMKSMPYDPEKDLSVVTILVEQTNVLAVSNELGIRTVKELIAKLQQNPGKYNYASIGPGSLSHMGMELAARASKTKVTHLPMKSSPEATMAVMRNDVQMTVLPLISVLPLAKEGKITLLAVTSEQRSSAAPAVPTFTEEGIEGVIAVAWSALVAPGSAHKTVIDEINRQTTAILNDPSVKAKFAAQIMVTKPMSVEQSKRYVDLEVAKWAEIVRATGIEAQ